jgi:hypothetical protein
MGWRVNTRWPAVSERDPSLGDRVLALDLVWRGGGQKYQYGPHWWQDVSRISHPRYDNPEMPEIQNALYGDGHVGIHGRGEFQPDVDDRLDCDNDMSFRHYYNGGFFFWGH